MSLPSHPKKGIIKYFISNWMNTMNCLLASLLCGLYALFAEGADEEAKGKYAVPVLEGTHGQLVLEVNQTLELSCRGRWELSWSFPPDLPLERLRVEESRCGKTHRLHCSRLTLLEGAQPHHTGSFLCRYRHQTQRQNSVYVYVADRRQPFVDHEEMSTDVLYFKEKQPLVIPCRVTHPNVTSTLVKFPQHSLSPDQRNILWNSKRGFTIRTPTFYYIGLFFCQTLIDGVAYKSRKYIVYRPVSSILDMYVNTSGPVQALKGERLVLNCTATGELNTRVNISWDYPGKTSNHGSTSKRLLKHGTHMLFYNILTIPKLQRSDRGLYTCRVGSGNKTKQQKVTVTVYDRPFIRLKPRRGTAMEARAGQKSYRISPKLRAYPAPEVVWLKDGAVAAEQCSRYHMDGHSLVIRDVAQEDAGKYTVRVGIREHALYRDLTLTLVVNASPEIGEKGVSSQDPAAVPRGSRQSLHCTSQGVPPPHVHWLWHPCPPKGPCAAPTSSSAWLPVSPGLPATSAHNRILSVSRRQEVLQGKTKTVGVVTVDEALVSGVFRCVATNSVGLDHLDIYFYVSDIPGGFDVSQDEEPREGGALHLTCSANKYLYATLSWRRLHPAGGGVDDGVTALRGQPSIGQFSRLLRLSWSNLSAQDSGAYVCAAQRRITGQEEHLVAQVRVSALEAPVLLDNLTDWTVNSSSSVILRCPTKGVPAPTVAWYKNRGALSQRSGIVMSSEDGSLRIERVAIEDQGLYTCRASNQKGSAESSAYVWVNDVSGTPSVEIPTLACTCVAATFLWLLLTLLIRKLRQIDSPPSKAEYLSIVLDSRDGPIDERCERLRYDPDRWEFPRDRLKLGRNLGRGAFGKVVQASAFGIDGTSGCGTVAVKMLKEGATVSEHKALMTELKILNYIGHHLNVVNLLGACTKPGGPLLVIVEYCRYGNLSSFLKSKREVFGVHPKRSRERLCDDQAATDDDESSAPLFLEHLISFSFQVARGMDFLASRKCIHRDLAARNVLLSDHDVVKICDFGLARDIYKNPDYVRQGDSRLPLKWMSPESIFDKVFTTQSDVWAFGVLLWEIFSLGASPYPGVHIDQEFCNRLKAGTRMRAPAFGTPEIYGVMLACWEAEAAQRPSFSRLADTLAELLGSVVQKDGKNGVPLDFAWEHSKNSETFPPDSFAVTNLSYMHATVDTFEETPCEGGRRGSDEGDSGMILPSEELRRVLLSNEEGPGLHGDGSLGGRRGSPWHGDCSPPTASCF
ncbi:vascular endothelial growth factor receptor 1 isoform X2 [Stigmatopora argus]